MEPEIVSAARIFVAFVLDPNISSPRVFADAARVAIKHPSDVLQEIVRCRTRVAINLIDSEKEND
jgi:hypothetical protein